MNSDDMEGLEWRRKRKAQKRNVMAKRFDAGYA